MTNDALPLALAAVGQTFVVLTNGIDLSTGAIVGLADVTIAVLGTHGLSGVGIVIVLAIGAFAGLANGLIVCYARIAPLITTLATGSIILGITLDHPLQPRRDDPRRGCTSGLPDRSEACRWPRSGSWC